MSPRRPDDDDDDGFDTFGALGGSYEETRTGDSEPPFARPKRYPGVASPSYLGIRKTLLGLEWREPYWVGDPQRLFRPEGLLVPNAPPGARLSEWNVGTDLVLPVGSHPIALSTFSLLEEIEASSSRRSAARPHFPTCSAGMLIRLKLIDASGALLGPPFEPTVWGLLPYSV